MSVRVHATNAVAMIGAALSALLTATGPARAVAPGANGKIVWANNRTTENDHLWVANADGSGAMILDPPTACVSGDPNCNPATGCPYDAWSPSCITTSGYDQFPAWSANGTRIAFDSNRNPAAFIVELFVMNANGSGVVELTQGVPPPGSSDPVHLASDPTWSPDGSKIAFVGQDATSPCCPPSHIWVISASNPMQVDYKTAGTQLTNAADGDLAPEWSPDGSSIAFVRNDVQGSHIYLMNPDGSNQRFIRNGSFPKWSPDGSKVVFAVVGFGGGIFTMNADGSNVTMLPICHGGDGPGAWSPDGTKIAYEACDGQIHEYGLLDGSDLAVAPTTTSNHYPDWQPLPGGSAAAGAVPDGGSVPGMPLTVSAAAGNLTLTWGTSCALGDSDYEVYEGTLAAPFAYNHTERLCSTGGATTATFAAPAESTYYLVVPRNTALEGSYGRASGGAEIPAGTSVCLPQLIAATCP